MTASSFHRQHDHSDRVSPAARTGEEVVVVPDVAQLLPAEKVVAAGSAAELARHCAAELQTNTDPDRTSRSQ